MNFPTDPMRQHDRFIDALCQDWLEAGTVTRVTPNADRILEISRQLADVSTAQGVGDLASPTVAGAPAGLSRCASQAKPLIDYRKGEEA